jgi:hypothetical protein
MVPDTMTDARELEFPSLDRQPGRVTTGWLDKQRLEFRLECTEAPILLVLVLRWDDRWVHYGRIHRSNADFQARIKLSLFSYRGESDKVEVRWFQRQGHTLNDGPRLLLHDQDLKENWHGLVTVRVDSAEELYTGSVFRLAEIRSEICAEALIITKSDAEATHARWRVRPEHVEMLPPAYQFLTNGSQHGRL